MSDAILTAGDYEALLCQQAEEYACGDQADGEVTGGKLLRHDDLRADRDRLAARVAVLEGALREVRPMAVDIHWYSAVHIIDAALAEVKP